MESCVRFSLSPIVSRAPFLSSSTSKTLASTGQKQVFEFLEKRRLQYMVRQVKMKTSTALTAAKQQKEGGASDSSGGELTAPIQAGRYRLCLEKEPDKFAEHIVVKAKANIKTKRRRRKRQSPPPPALQSRTTIASISEQSRPPRLSSTPRLNSSSSTHQHQTSLLSDQSLTSAGGVSSTTRHSISRDQDLVRQLYYSPLYQQVRREWRDTVAHKQMQKVSNVRRALNFDTEQAKPPTPPINRRQAHHNIISNNHTSSSTTISRLHMYTSSSMPSKTKPTQSKYEIKDPHSTSEHDRKKADMASKARQRSEIYALNALMKKLEEENFQQSVLGTGKV